MSELTYDQAILALAAGISLALERTEDSTELYRPEAEVVYEHLLNNNIEMKEVGS